MMQRIIAILLAFLLAAGPLPAAAQFYPGNGPPVVHPSSGNLAGDGCATGSTHQLWWLDQNACVNADRLNFTSSDPSADAIITLGGTLTVGDVLHIVLQFPGLAPQTLNVTIPSSPTPAAVINLIIAAVKANTLLFTSPNGGYGSGAPIGYIVNVGSTALAFDYNSQPGIASFLYTCTGTCGETLAVSSGWIGLQLYAGGTTSGSANAQACTATGWNGSIYTSVQCTIGGGLTNTGSTTLNINSIGAFTVQKYASNGSLTNLTGGELQAGSTYVFNWNPTSTWVLGYSAGQAVNGSTPGTTYFLPNALDNNPLWFPSRQASNGTPPNVTTAAAPGSALWNIQVGCADSNAVAQGGNVDINCATFALFVKNLTSGPTPPETAWYLNSASGAGWWIGHGIYANNAGSCLFNFQTNCGSYQDEGNGTINASGYYLGNILVAGLTGSVVSGFFNSLQIGNLAIIGTGLFQVHAGTDQNIYIAPHSNLLSGVAINVINDAANANEPLEILTSNLQISLGTLNVGIAGSITGHVIFNNPVAANTGIIVSAPSSGNLGNPTNTLQAANDTFVYKNTIDALTNKTINFDSNTMQGTTAADNACAGCIGEVLSANLASGSATSLTNATPKTITSVSLTAGDWDVFGYIDYAPAATTTISALFCSLSTATNTLQISNDFQWGAISNFGSTAASQYGQNLIPQSNCGPWRVNVSATTTYFLVAQASFSTSTMTGYGTIRARRIR